MAVMDMKLNQYIVAAVLMKYFPATGRERIICGWRWADDGSVHPIHGDVITTWRTMPIAPLPRYDR